MGIILFMMGLFALQLYVMHDINKSYEGIRSEMKKIDELMDDYR